MTDEKIPQGMRYLPKENFASMKMTKEEVDAIMAKIPMEKGHITEFYSGPHEWHENRAIEDTEIIGPMSDPIYKSLMDLNDFMKKENSKYESENVMPDKQGNLTQDEIVRMMRGFVPDQKTGIRSMFKGIVNKEKSEYGTSNEISDSDLKKYGLFALGSFSLFIAKLFINHKQTQAYKNQSSRGDNQEIVFYTLLGSLITVANSFITHHFHRLMQK